MTFSISARCPETGMFGIAISSSSPAVAARCSHVRAKAGVVASQNITDPGLGLRGLDLLATGMSAQDVVDNLVASTEFSDFRQLAVVDQQGDTAVFSGQGVLGSFAMSRGAQCVAAGNMLADVAVTDVMVRTFEATVASFPDRLLTAMRAGLAAGGEAGPVYSAGLKVMRDLEWPLVDLRVDWAENPIDRLQEIWEVYAPQMEDYVRRAVAPSAAPTFGVPGNL